MTALEIAMIQMKNTGRKKVALLASRNPKSEVVSKELWKRLREENFILTPKNPDIVISIGGDGMLLSAFHKYEKLIDRVRFVGIQTGH